MRFRRTGIPGAGSWPSPGAEIDAFAVEVPAQRAGRQPQPCRDLVQVVFAVLYQEAVVLDDVGTAATLPGAPSVAVPPMLFGLREQRREPRDGVRLDVAEPPGFSPAAVLALQADAGLPAVLPDGLHGKLIRVHYRSRLVSPRLGCSATRASTSRSRSAMTVGALPDRLSNATIALSTTSASSLHTCSLVWVTPLRGFCPV